MAGLLARCSAVVLLLGAVHLFRVVDGAGAGAGGGGGGACGCGGSGSGCVGIAHATPFWAGTPKAILAVAHIKI